MYVRSNRTGADPGFFLGGGALVSCFTSTPINHIVFFFLQNTSCIRKPQVISGEGAHPRTLLLDSPLQKIPLISLKVLLDSVVYVDKYSNFMFCVKNWMLSYRWPMTPNFMWQWVLSPCFLLISWLTIRWSGRADYIFGRKTEHEKAKTFLSNPRHSEVNLSHSWQWLYSNFRKNRLYNLDKNYDT